MNIYVSHTSRSGGTIRRLCCTNGIAARRRHTSHTQAAHLHRVHTSDCTSGVTCRVHDDCSNPPPPQKISHQHVSSPKDKKKYLPPFFSRREGRSRCRQRTQNAAGMRAKCAGRFIIHRAASRGSESVGIVCNFWPAIPGTCSPAPRLIVSLPWGTVPTYFFFFSCTVQTCEKVGWFFYFF